MANVGKKKIKTVQTLQDFADLPVGKWFIDDFKDLDLLSARGNYRSVVNRERVEALKASIRQVGVRKPIVVHVVQGVASQAEIIEGQHRWVAVKELREEAQAIGIDFGYRSLPGEAIVAESFAQAKATIDATISNFVTKQSIWDRAAQCSHLKATLKNNVDAVADAVGLDKRSVYNALAVFSLPLNLKAEMQRLTSTNQLSDTKVVRLAQEYHALINPKSHKRKTLTQAEEIIRHKIVEQPKDAPQTEVPFPIKAKKTRPRKQVPDASSPTARSKVHASAEVITEILGELTSLKIQLGQDKAGLLDLIIEKVARLAPGGQS